MAHAQKPDFVFRRNGRVHLNRQGLQFSRLMAVEVCASAVVMLDTPSSEVVKVTGYPLHSPVSPSLPLPCITVCHHVSTGLYHFGICSGVVVYNHKKSPGWVFFGPTFEPRNFLLFSSSATLSTAMIDEDDIKMSFGETGLREVDFGGSESCPVLMTLLSV